MVCTHFQSLFFWIMNIPLHCSWTWWYVRPFTQLWKSRCKNPSFPNTPKQNRLLYFWLACLKCQLLNSSIQPWGSSGSGSIATFRARQQKELHVTTVPNACVIVVYWSKYPPALWTCFHSSGVGLGLLCTGRSSQKTVVYPYVDDSCLQHVVVYGQFSAHRYPVASCPVTCCIVSLQGSSLHPVESCPAQAAICPRPLLFTHVSSSLSQIQSGHMTFLIL